MEMRTEYIDLRMWLGKLHKIQIYAPMG